MALSKDLQDLKNKPSSRLSCLIRTILLSLEEEDRKSLQEVLSNHSISGAQISRALIDNGIIIRSGAINKHRKGDCSCNVLDK